MKLTTKIRRTLAVEIGEDVYQLPLAGSMTPEELEGVNTFEGTVAFIRAHIPAEITAGFTIEDYNEITAAWAKESEAAAGVPLGESSASRGA